MHSLSCRSVWDSFTTSMKIGNGILGISGQTSNIGVVNIFIPRVIKLPAPLYSKFVELGKFSHPENRPVFLTFYCFKSCFCHAITSSTITFSTVIEMGNFLRSFVFNQVIFQSYLISCRSFTSYEEIYSLNFLKIFINPQNGKFCPQNEKCCWHCEDLLKNRDNRLRQLPSILCNWDAKHASGHDLVEGKLQ